jgi:hypothetical protein
VPVSGDFGGRRPLRHRRTSAASATRRRFYVSNAE